MPRSTPRLVTALALLLGLVTLSAAVAPSAIARAPSNDKFGHALKIGSLLYHHEESTRKARTQDSDPVTNCGEIGRTVWFKLRRASPAFITAGTAGSDFDTVLAVYEQPASGVGGLHEVTCNDDADGGSQSEITFAVTKDTTYYLLVGGCCARDQPASGHLELTVAKQ